MNLTVIIGLVALVVNVILSLVISGYSYFAMGVNSAVIIATTVLIACTRTMQLKDAFRISLSSLFAGGGFIAFVCGFFSIPQFEDNWVIIFDLILLVIGIVLLLSANLISKSVE